MKGRGGDGRRPGRGSDGEGNSGPSTYRNGGEHKNSGRKDSPGDLRNAHNGRGRQIGRERLLTLHIAVQAVCRFVADGFGLSGEENGKQAECKGEGSAPETLMIGEQS